LQPELTRGARFRLSAFLAILAIAVPVVAFDCPLTDDMIRDAYFESKMPQDRWRDFVAPYAHQLPPPKSGPDVAETGIETPYLQATEKSKNATDYFAEDAAQESSGKKMLLLPHVDIFVTPAYRAPNVPGFWKDFKVRLVEDQEIPAEMADASALWPLCDNGEESCFPDGARIQLAYDADKINSAPITVHVVAPDGHDVQTTFDLGALR
jgi:hypothetical protein